jgi:hypothetical protein
MYTYIYRLLQEDVFLTGSGLGADFFICIYIYILKVRCVKPVKGYNL